MKPVTEDKYLKFVIENYQNIKALNEVYDQAKTKLPLCAGQEVANAILDLKNGFFRKQGLVVTDEGEGPWWCDPKFYDKETWTGPYFQFVIEKFRYEWLVSNDPDYAANLIFYVDTGEIKGRAARISYINKWVKD